MHVSQPGGRLSTLQASGLKRNHLSSGLRASESCTTLDSVLLIIIGVLITLRQRITREKTIPQ